MKTLKNTTALMLALLVSAQAMASQGAVCNPTYTVAYVGASPEEALFWEGSARELYKANAASGKPVTNVAHIPNSGAKNAGSLETAFNASALSAVGLSDKQKFAALASAVAKNPNALDNGTAWTQLATQWRSQYVQAAAAVMYANAGNKTVSVDNVHLVGASDLLSTTGVVLVGHGDGSAFAGALSKGLNQLAGLGTSQGHLSVLHVAPVTSSVIDGQGKVSTSTSDYLLRTDDAVLQAFAALGTVSLLPSNAATTGNAGIASHQFVAAYLSDAAARSVTRGAAQSEFDRATRIAARLDYTFSWAVSPANQAMLDAGVVEGTRNSTFAPGVEVVGTVTRIAPAAIRWQADLTCAQLDNAGTSASYQTAYTAGAGVTKADYARMTVEAGGLPVLTTEGAPSATTTQGGTALSLPETVTWTKSGSLWKYAYAKKS